MLCSLVGLVSSVGRVHTSPFREFIWLDFGRLYLLLMLRGGNCVTRTMHDHRHLGCVRIIQLWAAVAGRLHMVHLAARSLRARSLPRLRSGSCRSGRQATSSPIDLALPRFAARDYQPKEHQSVKVETRDCPVSQNSHSTPSLCLNLDT